jgi:hypothetical protein
MHRRCRRLGTEKVSSADLRTRSAERERCRNGSPVGDPPAAIAGTPTASTTCGTGASVPGCAADVLDEVSSQKHSAMSAGLVALGDGDISAMSFQPARLLDRRC